MKISIANAKPKSAQGLAMIDGLHVDPAGRTEPFFIIRASEPAALDTLVNFLDAAKIRGYSREVQERAVAQLSEFRLWQLNAGGQTPRDLDIMHTSAPMGVFSGASKDFTGADRVELVEALRRLDDQKVQDEKPAASPKKKKGKK